MAALAVALACPARLALQLPTPQRQCGAMQQRSSSMRAVSSSRMVVSASSPAAAAAAAPRPMRPEAEVPGMTEFLDRLKWDANGLVVAIAQHADTGEVLMQAFADRAAVCETLQTG